MIQLTVSYHNRAMPLLTPVHCCLMAQYVDDSMLGVSDPSGARNIRVNGDGFGVAWYVNDANIPVEQGSCLFKLMTPAWSNANLLNIGEFIRSSLIMGHVRAASNGHNPLEPVFVSYENCHPFKSGRYTFMHNGAIPSFCKIRRALCNIINDDIYEQMTGTTDSEHIFALFLHFLPCRRAFLCSEVLAQTLQHAFCVILNLCRVHHVKAPCSLNVAISDGVNVIASRFRNNNEDPPSLYYSIGSNFSKKGCFSSPADNTSQEIIISSEPLNFRSCCDVTCREHWKLIPNNHMIVCTGDVDNSSVVKSVKLIPICCPNDEVESPSTNCAGCGIEAV